MLAQLMQSMREHEEPERIVGAAIQVAPDKIAVDISHAGAAMQAIDNGWFPGIEPGRGWAMNADDFAALFPKNAEGWVTNRGRFVDREEGLKIAQASNQTSKPAGGLKSEDISRELALKEIADADGFVKPLTIHDIESLRAIRDVSGAAGTWNYDPYFQGMYNGIEVIMACIDGREPVFKDPPKVWLRDVEFEDPLDADYDGIVATHEGLTYSVAINQLLNEATLSDLIKRNITVRMLFPDREDRVMEVGRRGGVRLRGMDKDTLYFSVHWGRYGPGSGLPEWYDVVWHFKDVDATIKELATDKMIFKKDGTGPDLRKLAVKVLNTADIEESCNCPSDLCHGFRYIRTKMGAQYGDRETRPPVKMNPSQRGCFCKHGEMLVVKYISFCGATIANWLKRYWAKEISFTLKQKSEDEQALAAEQSAGKQPIKFPTLPTPSESILQPSVTLLSPDTIEGKGMAAAAPFGE